jgi:uncharacterized cupredoxin-like copper-binding protein
MTTLLRRAGRFYAALAGFGLVTLLTYGASAQHTATPVVTGAVSPTEYVHPVTINSGTCAQPSADVVFKLGNTGPWGGPGSVEATGAPPPVLSVEAVVKKTLDDLAKHQGQPYAIVVHESTDRLDQLIACGDIQGAIVHGQLAIALRPLNNSGVVGVAVLDKDERGFLGLGKSETKVTVYLVPNATGATGGAPQPTETAGVPETTPVTETPTPQPPAETTTAPAAQEVAIGMYDIRFNPNLITIPANTPVTIKLTNHGAILHNFSITNHKNPHVKDLNISVNVNPGETKTVTINAPAGTYYFYCNVPGHEQAGMFGYVTAQAGAAIATAEATITPPAGS